MKPAITFVLLFFTTLLFSQKEGDTWVIGYSYYAEPRFSIMYLNFTTGELNIEYHIELERSIGETASSVCDSAGSVILTTNGMQIFGKNEEVIIDTIAYDGEKQISYWKWWAPDQSAPLGFPQLGGAVILPVPGKENEFSVLYHLDEWDDIESFRTLQYMEARISLTQGIYHVLYKDSIFSPGNNWYTSTLSATRHANGRDWWIVTFEHDSASYFVYLLDDHGIRLSHEGAIDVDVHSALEQVAFSSKGNYLARISTVSTTAGNLLTLYTFDRCSGQLEKLASIDSGKYGWPGLAFSPSEQYLYVAENWETLLYQYDMRASDIEASKTFVDTFDGFVQPGWFQMRFGPMMQTPDGRIYVVPSAGSSQFLHVIERPDLPAAFCKLEQHSIDLMAQNGRTAPNLPNYRLGPLDGSACDSLGLNNYPVSRWRYEENEDGIPFDIRFTDLSFFEPDVWLWDFGDGFTSNERNPIHTFDPGLYHVCLTVSNEYSSDSSCQWINVMTTSNEEVIVNSGLTIYPNPIDDRFTITSDNKDFQAFSFKFLNIDGALLFQHNNIIVPSTIFIPDIPSGTYMISLKGTSGKEETRLVVKN